MGRATGPRQVDLNARTMIPQLPIQAFTRSKSSRDCMAWGSAGGSSSSNSGFTQRSIVRET
jgi:hypothetical protein